MSTGDGPHFIEAPCTSGAYDYPRSSGIHHAKHILAVVHQAAVAGFVAQALMRGRNVAGYVGNTATWYVDPDGTSYHFIDGTKHVAWGSAPATLDRLDRTRASIDLVWRHCQQKSPAWNALINPNECAVEQVECSGSGTEPWTDLQFEAVATIVARASQATGLPITRDTVVPHRDFDTVDRPSDPWPAATREARMARLIARARELAAPQEPVMRQFTLSGRVADVTVKADAPHLAVPIDGRTNASRAWPKLTAGQAFDTVPGITLAVAVEGGLAGEDRRSAFLVIAGGEVCAVLAKDVTATPLELADPAAERAAIAAATTAGQSAGVTAEKTRLRTLLGL